MLPVMRIERFSVKDGDGVRTVIFLKGCPLRCKWCHNPEGLRAKNELIYIKNDCISCGMCASVCACGAHTFDNGTHTIRRDKCVACFKCCEACPSGAVYPAAKYMSQDEIVKTVLRDAPFFGDEGGVTLSGGEPTIHGEKTVALLRALKAENINTAVETCGYFPTDMTDALCGCVDTFLYDIKDTNDERHIVNTGVSNKRIIENLHKIDESGGRIILRRIVLKGINDGDEEEKSFASLAGSIKNLVRVDRLPYHPYGNGKYAQVGLDEPETF